MGQVYTKVRTATTARKRKFFDDDDTDRTPKRRKVLSTASYVYKTLFKEGQASDVIVEAVAKRWNHCWYLHKIYLCQSPYFQSMFNGSWLETNQNTVKIEIIDSNVTLDSMSMIFGSLYLGEITIDAKDVVSVLATASLFQLDSIIEQCTAVMQETINISTAVSYYESACVYGAHQVKENAFKWLCINLLSYKEHPVELLREISVALMGKLVSSPNLFVIEFEYSLYNLLRVWVIARLFPELKGDGVDVKKDYFLERSDQPPFLLTDDGSEYMDVFKALRLQNMLLFRNDVKNLRRDNIFPGEWINQNIIRLYDEVLRVDHCLKSSVEITGPTSQAYFYEKCQRFGRQLKSPGNHMWRWTGFNFGLDLVLIIEDGICSIKRNQRNADGPLLSSHTNREIIFSLLIASVNEQMQPTHIQERAPKRMLLPRNVEMVLCTLDKELTYPMMISFNVIAVPPEQAPFEQSS